MALPGGRGTPHSVNRLAAGERAGRELLRIERQGQGVDGTLRARSQDCLDGGELVPPK